MNQNEVTWICTKLKMTGFKIYHLRNRKRNRKTLDRDRHLLEYCWQQERWKLVIEIKNSTEKCIFVIVQSLSCVQLCNPMDGSTPDFPDWHYFPEFAQIQIHWVGDTIQPSHPLPPSSHFAINISHHQGLFQWVDSSHQVAKVLEFQLFHISPSNEYSRLISFRIDRFEKILSTANGVASGYFLVY